MILEPIHSGKPALPAAWRGNHLPRRDAARLVSHHQRAVPDQEAEGRHRAVVAGHVRDVGARRVGRVAHIVPDYLAARGADEQVLPAAVEPERRDFPLHRHGQGLERFDLGARPDERLPLHDRPDDQLGRADLRHGERTRGRGREGKPPDGPPPLSVEEGGLAELRSRRDRAPAILEGHIEHELQRDHPAVGRPDDVARLAVVGRGRHRGPVHPWDRDRRQRAVLLEGNKPKHPICRDLIRELAVLLDPRRVAGHGDRPRHPMPAQEQRRRLL